MPTGKAAAAAEAAAGPSPLSCSRAAPQTTNVNSGETQATIASHHRAALRMAPGPDAGKGPQVDGAAGTVAGRRRSASQRSTGTGRKRLALPIPVAASAALMSSGAPMPVRLLRPTTRVSCLAAPAPVTSTGVARTIPAPPTPSRRAPACAGRTERAPPSRRAPAASPATEIRSTRQAPSERNRSPTAPSSRSPAPKPAETHESPARGTSRSRASRIRHGPSPARRKPSAAWPSGTASRTAAAWGAGGRSVWTRSTLGEPPAQSRSSRNGEPRTFGREAAARWRTRAAPPAAGPPAASRPERGPPGEALPAGPARAPPCGRTSD